MSPAEIGQVAATVVVSVASGGGLVLWLSKWIGELLANRYVERVKHELQQEMESYRTKLKKSEFLFQKEFEAASEFIQLRRRLWPRMRHPDEEWDEAVTEFGRNLEKVEEEVGRYLSTHGAALQERVLEMVRKTVDEAEYGKFEWEESGPSRRIAEGILDRLKEIEDELRSAVWAQSST